MSTSSPKLRGIIHCHSNCSFDSRISTAQYLRFARKQRLDFIILTDHDTVEGSRALQAAAAKRFPELDVPLAAEYLTEHGDVIAVFLKDEITARTLPEFVQEARDQGALLLLPHPYVAHREVETLANECDLIETFNSRISTKQNQSAVDLAVAVNKPAFGGSDAHLANSLARVIVEVENKGSLRESLLMGDIQWTSLPTPKWETSASQLIKAWKKRDLALARTQLWGGVRYAGRRVTVKVLPKKIQSPRFNRLREQLQRPSAFRKGIMTLLSGSVAGQVIAVLASPLLTRLYTPASFGIAGVYLSILGITSNVSMLRYETAIAATTEQEEAATVTCLSGCLAVLSGILLMVLVPVAAKLIPHFRPQESMIVPYLYWIPIGAIAVAVYLALSLWAVRHQQYKALSRTKVRQSILAVVFQLVAGMVRSSPVGLIAGQILGQSGGVLTLAGSASKLHGKEFRSVTVRKILDAAKKYRRFPIMSVPAVALENLFANVPLLVIVSLYGVVVGGWVTLVQRMIFLPGFMLAQVIGQAVLGEMSQVAAANPEQLEHVFWQRLKQISVLAFGLCGVIALIVPFVVHYVFGSQWGNASLCAELLLPMVLGTLISSVFGTALDVLQRQDLHLLREAGRFLLMVGTMVFIAHTRPSWKLALGIVGIMSFVAYGWYLLLSWWAIHYRPASRSACTVTSE